ncbi:MAG: BamA/TamA family outer membrane protein [Gemmatimonadota bacterium]
MTNDFLAGIRGRTIVRHALIVGALVLGSTRHAAAQRWVDSRYPYLTSSANDFPMLAARFQWSRGVDDYLSPLPYSGNLSLDGGLSTRGSYFLTAQFRAPGLKEGWRFASVASVARESRFGFFGVGNDTRFDESLVNDAQPYFYRVKRERSLVQAEITRRLVGHLHVSGAAGFDHTKFNPLPGPSIFRDSFPDDREDNDVTGRISLIFDTRDNEYNTTRGIMIETGAMAGSGGEGYSRFYGSIRGFVPIRDGAVVAARLLGSATGGTPPLHARFELPMWENTLTVFGGTDSHRAFDDGRFGGEHVLFANLEVRHNIIDLATLGAISAVGFVDAGRVFEGEKFRLTTDKVKVGAGAGLAIRLLRSTIFTFNLARGDEGWNFTINNGWLF